MTDSTSLIPAPPTGLQTWSEWGTVVAIRLRQTPTKGLPAARDSIGRLHRIAQELGDQEAIVETSIADQEVKREIGKRHERQAPPGVASEDRSTDETIPKATVSRYRADAESLTDTGFEQVAEAAREEQKPLDRATVRAAGVVEQAGGDPAEAVRKPVHVAQATGNPEWNTPVRILEAARLVLGGTIDLDPASTPEANERVKAVRFFTAEQDALADDTLWMPEDGEWSGSVWLNPPYDAGLCAGFAGRLLQELAAGTVERAIWISNNAMETKWAQGLQCVALCYCNLAGRVKFLDSLGEERLSPLQGQAVLGFGVDVGLFRQAFGQIGSVWVR